MGSLVENKGTSSFLTAINLCGVTFGLGQLSMPYALQNGGWSSSIVLVVFGVLGAYTSHLLGLCLKKKSESKTYSDIAYEAFGMKGRILVVGFIYLEVFLALISFTISMSDNLKAVLSGVKLHFSLFNISTSNMLTVIAVVVSMPSVWLRDLTQISFISTIGILLSIIISLLVACTAIFGGVKLNQPISMFETEHILSVCGLYIFNIGAHVVIPQMYKSMRNPAQFTTVSFISFCIVTVAYTCLAFLGAKMFGPKVNSQVTLSMPKHLAITRMALWAATVMPMTKYAVMVRPITAEVESRLPSSMNGKTRFIVRGAVGSLALMIVMIIALSVPWFDRVLGLTGSFVIITVSVILPCSFYVKIFWSEISKLSLVLHMTIVALSVVLGLSGTISTIKSFF